MEKITNLFVATFQGMLDNAILLLPGLFAGLLLFVLAWLVARIISRLLARALRVLRFDTLMEQAQVGNYLRSIQIEQTPSQIVGKFIYWLLMLLVFVGFAETMDLGVISEKIGTLINYLPNVVIALLILIGGLYLASRLRDVIHLSFQSYGMRAGRMISNILFYLIALFIVLTALEQLQFNIALLSTNVMILLAGVALAFALGYGLAAKEIFPHIISSYYSKSMYQVGNHIRVGEAEGKIIEITNLSVVIRTKEGKRYIPAKKLITEEVDLLDS